MSWADKYVGLTHEPGVFDCASLVELVELQEFRRDIALPKARGEEPTNFIPTDTPIEGDIVLMLDRGRPQHVGVYCEIGGVPHVLHAMEHVHTCLHPIAALGKGVFTSVKLEGFYRPEAHSFQPS